MKQRKLRKVGIGILCGLVPALTVPAAITPFFFIQKEEGLKSYRVQAPVDSGTSIKQTDYTKVFIITGQSNAVGYSHNEYLQYSVSKSELDHFKSGIDKVEISFAESRRSPLEIETSFGPTTCYCGAMQDRFGPELGFAETMEKYSDEKVYIIKYGLQGTFLDGEWLANDKSRGVLYNNLTAFVDREMTKIPGDNKKICGICWMQGENDGIYQECATDYYNNLVKLVGYMREDFSKYAPTSGIPFIDAGITNYTGCWQYFDDINKAKIDFWKTNEQLNGYFSTWENGLDRTKEPYGDVDPYHYDAFSELKLGRWFALKIIDLFNKNN